MKHFTFAGPRVLAIVRNAYRKWCDLRLVQLRLRYADEAAAEFNAQYPGDRHAKEPELLEEGMSRLLTASDGVRWELRRVGDSPIVALPWLEVKLTDLVEELPASYDTMAVDTLYRPLRKYDAACDLVYKDGSTGTLVCLQASWTTEHTVKRGPFRKFCHAMGLCATDDGQLSAAEERHIQETVHFVCCPRPSAFKTAQLTFETGCVLQGGDIMRMGEGFTSGVK